MRRELWAVSNTFASAVKILNSIFCSDGKDEEYSPEELALVVETIRSECSDMMIDDALLFLSMAEKLPKKRLCIKTDCLYHHPKDYRKHDFRIYQDRCDKCPHNTCKYNKEEKNQDGYTPKSPE